MAASSETTSVSTPMAIAATLAQVSRKSDSEFPQTGTLID
jgi:hypothetical protein